MKLYLIITSVLVSSVLAKTLRQCMQWTKSIDRGRTLTVGYDWPIYYPNFDKWLHEKCALKCLHYSNCGAFEVRALGTRKECRVFEKGYKIDSRTYNSNNGVAERPCFEVEYHMSVMIGDDVGDVTKDTIHVTVIGRKYNTRDYEVKQDFDERNKVVKWSFTDVDVGDDYKGVKFRTEGVDGLVFAQMDVSMKEIGTGKVIKTIMTFYNVKRVRIDDKETVGFYPEDDETIKYPISVKIGAKKYDGTVDDLFVILDGEDGRTTEQLCYGDFSQSNTVVECTISSTKDIGELKCMYWRTYGPDGSRFSQMDFYPGSAKQQTIYNEDHKDLVKDPDAPYVHGEVEVFCDRGKSPGYHEYKITVTIEDGTTAKQFVKIKSNQNTSAQKWCVADFSGSSTVATCTVHSLIDVEQYACVIWFNDGDDAWKFTKMDVSIDGVKQKSFNNVYEVAIKADETMTLCSDDVQYKITVTIDKHKNDGTKDDQDVKIMGTESSTDSLSCIADFSTPSTIATCHVYSRKNIGSYSCVMWLNAGSDGWRFSQMDVEIDGIKQETFYNKKKVPIKGRGKKKFCSVCADAQQQDYRGNIATTSNGFPCLKWTDVDSSNGLTKWPESETGVGNHNYCRNPDNEDRAWCYPVGDPNNYYDFCGIPHCTEE